MPNNTKFVNPFKTGKFSNPAVSLEESRKRSAAKIKKMRESKID
ncbi:hypothetical protein ACNH6B_05075 [Shewanella basaltis]|jgi:hypothetical protein|tara:strand:- start:1374 stop:1505 length:132 start_codon:yes stop_codon:yes gene_type:complete